MTNEKDQKTEALATGTPSTPQNIPFVSPMVDSTAHIEISFMQNDKFSEEIIQEAGRVFDLKKLRALGGDNNKFLAEAKIQINKMWHSIEALGVHTDLFIVTFQINLGYLLDVVESAFSSQKFKYTNWLRNNFGDERFRYFQQARQLARMGDTAVKYRSLGKNRLLDVDRLQKTLNLSFEEILKNHPFMDTTQDLDGDLWKAHVDSIITFYRFKTKGVENVKFDQAAQMASYEHKAVEVGTITKFKKEWDKAKDKDGLLDKYVLDKMAGAAEKKTRTTSGESLNRLLAVLNSYFETRDINDAEWIEEQRELLDKTIFYKAYGHLTWLKKKLKKSPSKSKKNLGKRRGEQMKLFMAITNWQIVPAFYNRTGRKLNIMISYHYLSGQAFKLAKEYRDRIDLLYLDSGAFSASTGRSKITVHAYLRYLKSFGHLFDQVFNFDDEFENPDHNLENQNILERGLAGTGIKVIPVVHDLQGPVEEFGMYAESGHDYIAIGSNRQLTDAEHNKIKKAYPKVKIHMFGNFRRKMLFTHKPYSADSAAYADEAGTGNILYWDPIDKKEYSIYVGGREKKGTDFIHFKKFSHRKNLEKFLWETFKYDYQGLLNSLEAMWIVNMYFFTKLEDVINQSK